MKKLSFKNYSFMVICTLFFYSTSNAQYIKRKPQRLPELKYYTPDARLFTNSDLADESGLILLYLNPVCEACHEEMKQILDNMDYLKDMEILIISPNSRDELAGFAKQYELEKYAQITILHDPRDFFYRQFKVTGYPSLYMYNSKKELISEFDSFVNFSEIMDDFAVTGK
jgi:peroxiredoxin